MNIYDWAKREVEIACARERKDGENESGEWDYGCACYESALKAFKSLTEDGHSGFSIGLTKNILVRLIEGKPLTPVEDTDDVWSDVICKRDDHTSYQCKRMSSLFKDVYDDGTIKYHDNNSYYCIDFTNPNITYHSGLVSKIIDELFPITMPYYPSNPIKVYCKDLLTDWKNGDFDTVGIFYAVKPNGERVDIYRYFKESNDGWTEITKAEYDDRKRMDREKHREVR